MVYVAVSKPEKKNRHVDFLSLFSVATLSVPQLCDVIIEFLFHTNSAQELM